MTSDNQPFQVPDEAVEAAREVTQDQYWGNGISEAVLRNILSAALPHLQVPSGDECAFVGCWATAEYGFKMNPKEGQRYEVYVCERHFDE